MNIRSYILFYRIFLDKLPYLVFHVTSKCNAKCKHCFNWKNVDNKERKKEELSLSEIEKISKKLGMLYFLTLSGGEPTIRNDLSQIVKIFARNNKPVFITIPTNGYETKKITKMFRKILNQNPGIHFRISVSIDDIGNNHDKIRKVPGMFENVLETIKILKTFKKDFKNFTLFTAMVFSRYNQDNFKDILDFTGKIGLDSNGFVFIRGSPRDNLSDKISLIKAKKVLDYFKNSIKFKSHPFSIVLRSMHVLSLSRVYSILLTKKRNFKCYATKKSILVDDVGDVWPCEYLNKKIGNLRDEDYDIHKILKNRNIKEIRGIIAKNKCTCTWDCNIMSSFVYNIREYPRIIKQIFIGIINRRN
jgi:MoaA/NifB/PqqE/SkfB family radical SAM enzyme